MANKRHRILQSKRDRARAATNELELFEHDKRSCTCDIRDIPVPLEDLGREIREILHFDSKRRLVWFAVIYSKVVDGRGTELYSVDTGHGYLHEHVTGHRKRNDRRNIRPMYSQVDVQQCFDEGYDMVMDKHLTMSGRLS